MFFFLIIIPLQFNNIIRLTPSFHLVKSIYFPKKLATEFTERSCSVVVVVELVETVLYNIL